jgi:anti-sigma regulatory factor (Ser/Thr protein kinase)
MDRVIATPRSLNVRVAATLRGVPAARFAVTSLCDDLGIDGELRNRVRLATTEACTNCVLHAYAGRPAGTTYGLDAHVEQGALVVSVQDSGVGLFGSRARGVDDDGRGIALIDLVSDSADIWSRAGEGTRVTMRFALPERVRIALTS